MKVIHLGFTQVKNTHTKIDWLIKVKLCLLHVNGNEIFIEDRIYEQELQKTSQGTFQIEKVLKRQGDKSLVKWMGYPKLFNS